MRPKNLFNYGMRNPGGLLAILRSLPKYIRLISRLMGDSRVPLWPKILMILSLIYLVSPFDFIPDFIFLTFGYADDMVLVILAASYLLKASPDEVVREHVAAIEGE